MSKLIEYYKSESFENTEKLKNKLNLLKAPMEILNDQELDELKKLLRDIEKSFDKMTKTYEDSVKNNILSKSEIEASSPDYDECKEQITFYKNQVDLYQDKLNNKLHEGELGGIASSSNNPTDVEMVNTTNENTNDQNFPAITRVFLNTIITTQHIVELKKQKNLMDERRYLSTIFYLKLDDGKDQILVDFYMTMFTFTIKQRFSLEKTSTFFSIMYFLFNYSILSKKIIKQKSLLLFNSLIDYHCIHRPPYAYQVFDLKEKNNLLEFVKNTFFRNYSLFENIFKYNVNIYLSTKEPKKIPKEEFPAVKPLELKYMIDDINSSEFYNFILETYVKENKKNDDLHVKQKSEIEEYSEQQMNKLNSYMSMFYASNNHNNEENNEVLLNKEEKEKKERELQDAKEILEFKNREIIENTNEFIKIEDRLLENEIAKKMPEPIDKTKKK